MKRPAALIGFTYLIGLLVASFLPEIVCFVLFLIGIGLGIGLFFFRIQKIARSLCPVLLVSGFAFGMFAAVQFFQALPLEALDGCQAVLKGEFRQVEYTDSGVRLLLKVDQSSLDQAPQSFLVRLTGSEKELYEVGDRFTAQVTLKSVRTQSTLSQYRSLRAKGIFLTGFLNSWAKAEENPSPSIMSRLAVFSQQLSSGLSRLIPGEAGRLACALSLGDRSGLSQETSDGFRTAGVSHLLALSGLHLSLLCTMLLRLLRRFAISDRICYTITILVVIGYMCLTGFGFSIQRAGIMQILSCLALLCYRKADPLSSLGFSVGVICLFNPYAAVDTGLLLSVCTTGAILLFAEKWKQSAEAWLSQGKGPFSWKTLRIAGNKLAGPLSVSLAASTVSFPLSILCFGSVSLIGPFATLLCAPFLPVIMLGGLGAAVFQWIGLSFLATPLAVAVKWCVSLLIWGVRSFAQIPFTSLFLGEPYVICWMMLVSIGIFCFRLFYRRIPVVFYASCLTLLLISSVLHQLLLRDVVTLRFVEEGKEAGAAISQNGQAFYFGSLLDSSSCYESQLLLGQDELFGVCLFHSIEEQGPACMFLKEMPPDWVGWEAEEEPFLYSFPVPLYRLTNGSFSFSDGSFLETRQVGSGAASFLQLEQMNILVLDSQADAFLLPATWTKPDILLSLGPGENLSVVRPRNVLVIGEEERIARRNLFLAAGANLLTKEGLGKTLVQYQFRYGDDLMKKETALTVE